MSTNVMVDLETLSTEPNAVVVAVGAVVFDVEEGLGDSYYAILNPDDQARKGRHISGSTVLWWLEQNEQARMNIALGAQPTHKALVELSAWLEELAIKGGGLNLWGDGSDFDCVILTSLFKDMGIKRPWGYRDHRCYRTLRNLRPDIPYTEAVVQHDALSDAVAQAKHAIDLLRVTTYVPSVTI